MGTRQSLVRASPEVFVFPGHCTSLMQRTFQTRIVAVLLALFTGAAVIFAGFNLVQESKYQSPTDGVWWVEGPHGLQAQRVPNNSPGERAGVKPGDLLLAANNHPVHVAADVSREIGRTGAYNTIHYTLERRGFRLPNVPVILDLQDRSIHQGFRFIALVYLGIGLYVLLRRWTAPNSTHFYIFCLVSFVLYAFWYTGKFNEFRLDCVLEQASARRRCSRRCSCIFRWHSQAGSGGGGGAGCTRWRTSAGAAVVGLQILAQTLWSATEILQHRLDQVSVWLRGAVLRGGGERVFYVHYRRAKAPLERQQLKWLTRGTLLAVAPFTLLSAIPYMADVAMPDMLTRVARHLPGVSAADLQLGHCALPHDGRGPDLQAGRDVYAGDGGDCGGVFRAAGDRGGGGAARG